MTLLKLLLGAFIASDEISISANQLVDRANDPLRRRLLLAVTITYWAIVIAIGLGTVSVIFWSKTLFNINSYSEYVLLETNNQSVPIELSLKNVSTSLDCDESTTSLTGTLALSGELEIIFTRQGNNDLQVSIIDYSGESSGTYVSLDGEEINLPPCIVLLFSNDQVPLTFAIDGNIQLGAPLTKGNLNVPLLLSGSVAIADRGLISRDYYTATTHQLNAGDVLSISGKQGLESGVIRISSDPGMEVSYQAKGDRAIVSKYHSEEIHLNNSVWIKLVNDESLIVLWLLVIILFRLTKLFVRYALDD